MLTRRKFGLSLLGVTAASEEMLSFSTLDSADSRPLGPGTPSHRSGSSTRGTQRLSLPDLSAWEALGYGMFLNFGMCTFTGVEWADGTDPSSFYDPDRLDVDQWIQTARDAGMKYAVPTTKHVSEHCLWPSRYMDYTVAHNSGNTQDVV